MKRPLVHRGYRPVTLTARLEAYNPNTRKTVVERRQRLQFSTPAQLIRAAHDALEPGWEIQGVVLFFASNDPNPSRLRLQLGTDETGTNRVILIPIPPALVPQVVAHLVGAGPQVLMIQVAGPVVDDGGGEELPVPTGAMAAFENLSTDTAVRQ